MGKEAETGQESIDRAIRLLQTAISDLKRLDRIDALDAIRMAEQRIRKTMQPQSATDKK